MFPQALLGALDLFGFEGRHNLFVFGLLLGESRQPLFTLKRRFGFAALRGVDAGDGQMGVQAGVDLFEPFVAGRLQQGLVQVAVGLFVPAQRLFVVDGLAQQGEQFVKLLLHGAGQARNGQFGGQAFEGAADFEGRLDILDGQGGDEGAGAGTDFNQSFGAQALDGVADGGEGDAEFFGDLFDLQALAGLETPGENGIAQGFVHLVGGAFPGKSAKFHSVTPFIINIWRSHAH